jgi:hypothetical protein
VGIKISVDTAKIVVFKKGGKLSGDEKWWLDRKEMEIVKYIKYLGVMLDSRGKWDKERKQVLIRGKIALSSINICLARAQNIQVKVLEQIQTIESRMLTGVEILGLEGGWKEIRESLRDVL